MAVRLGAEWRASTPIRPSLFSKAYVRVVKCDALLSTFLNKVHAVHILPWSELSGHFRRRAWRAQRALFSELSFRNFPHFPEPAPRVHCLVDVSRFYPGGVLVHARGIDGGLVACAWPASVAGSLGLFLRVGQSRCRPAVGVLAGGGVGGFCLPRLGEVGGNLLPLPCSYRCPARSGESPRCLSGSAAAHPFRGAAGWPLRWCFYCPGLMG